MREVPPAERRAAPVRLRWTEWAWVAGLAAWAVGLALLGAALAQRPDGLLHLWALDVGQGDALLIQTPQGGGVFSDSSISWAGALAHNGYDNNVSRITENVVRRFLEPKPL